MHVLEKVLIGVTTSITGTTLSAAIDRCMEIFLFSPSVMFKATPMILIITPAEVIVT